MLTKQGYVAPELTFRPNTNDHRIWREMKWDYRGLEYEDSIVLDIGCHVGFFAWNAIANGAKHVTGYEPHPENYQIAKRHLKDMPCTLFNSAVTSTEIARTETVKLYSRLGSTDKANHSLFVQGGRIGMEVYATSFEEALAKEPFDVVKIDIEGGEYALDLCLLPDTVKMIAIEFHLNKKQWREVGAGRIVRTLEALDFEAIKVPSLGGMWWNTTGVWRRS